MNLQLMSQPLVILIGHRSSDSGCSLSTALFSNAAQSGSAILFGLIFSHTGTPGFDPIRASFQQSVQPWLH
jgi:hypothetical protein